MTPKNQDIKASIIVIHGIAEHAGRHLDVKFNELNS